MHKFIIVLMLPDSLLSLFLCNYFPHCFLCPVEKLANVACQRKKMRALSLILEELHYSDHNLSKPHMQANHEMYLSWVKKVLYGLQGKKRGGIFN